MRVSARLCRMPSIIEAWLRSSDRIMQPGIRDASVLIAAKEGTYRTWMKVRARRFHAGLGHYPLAGKAASRPRCFGFK